MIIDTHCHYNLEPFYQDWTSRWSAARAKNVAGSIVVGTDTESNTLALKIAHADPDSARLFFSLGFHPHTYQDFVEQGSTDLEQLEQKVTQDLLQLQNLYETDAAGPKKLVAIGEIGLDYFRLPSQNPDLAQRIQQLQRLAFQKQVTLAKQYHLPVILHVRDTAKTREEETAYWETLQLIEEAELDTPFILHCVSGPLEYVEQAVSLGAYIGVAGNVTYKNASHIRTLVSSIPKNRILLETDAPYLPPQQYRGQVCEPWMISLTAEFLDQELGITQEHLLQNTLELFPQLSVCTAD